MKLSKILSQLLAGSVLVGGSLSAYADDFAVVNKTDTILTLLAKECSAKFGAGGVIQKRSAVLFPDAMLETLCGDNSEICIVEMYPSENCTGAAIARIVFGGDRNLMGVIKLSDKYNVHGDMSTQNVVVLSKATQ